MMMNYFCKNLREEIKSFRNIKKYLVWKIQRGTLRKERKKALNEINECNKLLDAKVYVERIEELERNLDLLKDLRLPKNREKYKIEIQKVFINCLEKKIDEIISPEQKKQAVSLLSVIRYYNFVIYNDEKFIKDVEELSEEIARIEGKILLKLYDIKAINPITKDLETDIGIITPLFNTRIMRLENAIFYVEEQNNLLEISIYDGNTLELQFTIDNLNNVELKGRKKVKLFTK